MKKATLLALALSAVVSASAQTDLTPSGISFRLGIGLPSDGAVRDGNRILLGVGADYYFSESLIRGHTTYVSFDWLGRAQSGRTVNIFPILGNVRFNAKNELGELTGFYWYGGLGVAFLEAGPVRSRGVFAARLGVGMDFSNHLFGEVNYLFTNSNRGVRGNSLNFYVGYRF